VAFVVEGSGTRLYGPDSDEGVLCAGLATCESRGVEVELSMTTRRVL
jgi:hypothetical protein